MRWQQISHTQNKMCSRSTTMQTAVVNFAILMQCDEVYCCKSSSLTDWLQHTPTAVHTFEKTRDVNWHHLTRNAQRDIEENRLNLFNLHYTALHAVPHPIDVVMPASLLQVVRKLTDRALYKLVQIFEDKGILPNCGKGVLLSRIPEWTSQASADTLNENRREFQERAKALDQRQGWAGILLRVVFFDFLIARYGVLTEFSGGRSNCKVYFSGCSDKTTTYASWSHCLHGASVEAMPPWRRSRALSSQANTEPARKKMRLMAPGT